MKIEQGHRSRVDENGAKRIKAGGIQEGFQEQIGNEAFQCGDGALEGSFPASDIRKGKSLRFLVSERPEDEANIARSRALQEAVCQGVIQAQRHFQQHQQSLPQQNSVVQWERFLPQRQLQVLLVEDDDATRHVVSALLRNCSYEVTSAANGMLAWELLMDQNNHVDLVLTEVVMPCLSGIGLLGRIMSHEAFKHIPVIMMSSHDAMNVVFKCLSKGAVDFLVKPVRKNELKNLWQHVWRRCNSSSGSRSASGSQTQKTTGPNNARDLNESGSNSESDKSSSEINIRGGSDNGSGTQSRWTKGALEVESGHQSDMPNSTELKLGVGLRQANCTEDMSVLGHEQHEEKDVDKAVAPDCATPKVPALGATDLNHVISMCDIQGSAHTSVKDTKKISIKEAGIGSSQGNTQREPDLVAKLHVREQDSNEEQQGDNEDEEGLLEKHASNSLGYKDKNISDSSSPSLPDSSNPVSMKRLRDVEEQEQLKGVGGGLVHSYTSAFSRYNNSSNFTSLNARTNVPNAHTLYVDFENGVAARESHTISVMVTSQKENVVSSNHGCDEFFAASNPGSSNKLEGVPELSPSAKHGKEEVTSLTPVAGSCSPSEQPNFSGNPQVVHRGASAHVGESGEAKGCDNYNQDAYTYPHNNTHSQYHHHSHHHHHHHHVQHHYHHIFEDKPRSRPKTLQPNEQTVTDVSPGAPKCGSSNILNGAEGTVGPSGSSNGYGSNGNGAVSVNGSATGSNYGSNGQSTAGMISGEGNTDANAQGEPDNGFLPDTNGILSRHDESHFARREAALTKFRRKRKERCFEKKVRYQSRKRLAEQRPRVRGQFVKQTLYGSTIGEPGQN